MRASAAVLLIVACSGSPADRVQPIRNTTRDAGVAGDASLVEQQGIGNCARDEDCELSDWAAGCGCHGTCQSYAINKRELAARTGAEKCPKVRTQPCPKPAPCPAETYHVLSAKCSRGKCAAVVQLIAPAHDPAF